ncbi:digestive cysteine proteinase 2 [Manduca sexta]|nr:digestive cysteine proteinase 2 [Manduca sexta]
MSSTPLHVSFFIKMLPVWYILSFLIAAISAQDIWNDDSELSWPEKYTVEAIRISLTAGLVENHKAWRTNVSSRIDYNNGVVKSITKENSPNFNKYEIHPEFTKNSSNVVKCNAAELDPSWQSVSLEQILPDTDDFEFVDLDPVNDKDTWKFFKKESLEGSDIRRTVWAEFDNETEVWIPVRYEVYEYNEWLGFLSKHDIWDFFEFSIDFDEDVFETDDYGCDEEYTMHEMNSESVTKHLMFIDPENDKHVDHVFNAFKSKHNKVYKDNIDHAKRKNIFQNKMRLIRATNRKNLGYKLAVNQFADRTPEEMKRYKGLLRRPEGKTGNIAFPYKDSDIKNIETDLPDEYDARLLGLVSAVKNQDNCGSCWTFGTTAAVEGALAQHNGGKLLSLSNQALIDCAWPFGVRGCEGGSDNAAYEWMMEYGLPTEAEYGPYLNRDNYCHIDNVTVKYPIKGFTDVTPYSVGALKVALVNHGPLSVSVHASEAFTLYSGGIFYDTECDPTSLDHEVALVGYGTRDEDTFWILKNSWGPMWGIDGYMLISSRDNNCGVATEPTYVNF